MRHKKKRFAVFQLIACLLILFNIFATPIVALADDSGSSSEKTESSEKNDKDKDNDSGSNESALKKLEETIGTKNNIMNGKFPTAAREAALEGPLKYDVQTQILMTYSILSDSYPASKTYADIYKTGDTAVESLQKVLPDMELKKMGTDNLVKSFTDSTKSKEQKETDQRLTKADRISTSSFKTDMSKKEMAKWKTDKNDKFAMMVEPYAKAMAENLIKAISLDDSRDPVYSTWLGDTSYKNDKNVWHMLSNFSDHVTNAGQDLAIRANGKHKSRAVWGGGYLTKRSGDNSVKGDDLIGVSSYGKQIQDDVQTYYTKVLTDYLINHRDEFKSAKDMQNALNKKTAMDGVDGRLDGTDSKLTEFTGSVFGDYAKTIAFAADDSVIAFLPWGTDPKSINGDKVAEIVKPFGVIYPTVAKEMASHSNNFKNGKWFKNYQNLMNKKLSGKISKDQFEFFKKMANELNDQKNKAKDAVDGNAVLSWVPVVPYSQEYSDAQANNTSKSFSEGYSQKNGVLMKGEEFGSLIPDMFVQKNQQKNPLYVSSQKKGPQLVVAGNPNAKLTDNRSIYDFTALNASRSRYRLNENSRVTYMYSDAMYSGVQGVSGDNLMGMDSYGNIIDGKDFKVIVPYWQNSTMKAFAYSNPFATTTMPVSSNGWISGNNGETNVKDDQIKSVANGSATAEKYAKAIRDELKQSGATSSKAKFVAAANKAVGKSGNDLTDEAAAGLAVLITAGTSNDVKKVNEKVLKNGETANQLYIGESVENKTKKQTGTGLYTAADVIQRYGLTTDFGLFDQLRKTVATWLVSTYNNEILQGNSQNVFYTEVFGENGSMLRFGLEPYFYAMLFLEVILAVVTTFQYYRGSVRGSIFIKRFLLFNALAIFFGMFGTGVVPKIESMILNKPLEVLTNGPMKRESVLDQWSKLKQQQTVNNVFYQGLFQDKYGQINKSTNYLIPFYTSTTVTGAVDPSVSDPQSELAKKDHSAANDQLTANQQLINKATYRKGNGKVPFTTPYKYKKVYVTLADLTNWASHMTRQKLSAEGKITEGSSQYEKPAEGYEPGKEPLFTWLANDYQKIPAGDQTSEGNKEFEFMDDGSGSSDSDSDSSDSSSSDSDKDDNKDKESSEDKDKDSDETAMVNDDGTINKTVSADETSDSSSSDSDSSDSDNSDSENSDSEKSDFDDSSDSDPADDYGKKLNPADTTGKSSYDSNNRGAWLDNSKMYTNFNKYAEFAAQTKHYADKDAKQYGTDVDSGGGQVTASQMFLELWQTVFQNSGEGRLPGDAKSFTALMNFAQAMNGNMGTQTTDSDVGKTGEVTVDTVGSVGRNSLINELSMTKYQRSLLNGGQKFSTAAQQMIDSFKIPAGESDYFNLDKDGSIIDIMRPYAKNQTARDALIFDINKKVLNDYVNIYSDVRAQVNPSNANSSEDSFEGQEDKQDVDAFTMAEAQIMAADIFFTINQRLGYKMFPTEYSAKSISLDSWNRMLFVPIGAMKKINDNSLYDSDNKSSAAAISLQDNVVEYLALQSPLGTLFMFTIMNYALILFGLIMKLMFLFLLPVTIVMSLARYFIFRKGSLKGLFLGSLFMTILFATIKLFLGLIFMYRSTILNKNWTLADGLVDSTQTMASALSVLAFLILVFVLTFAYIKFIFRNFWTLGVGEDGQLVGNLFRKTIGAMSPRKLASRATSFRARRLKDFWAQRRFNKSGTGKIRSAISNHTKNISHKVGDLAKARLDPVTRRIKDSKLVAKLSKGNKFFKMTKVGLASNLNNMLNAKVGGIEKTGSGGINIDELKRAGLSNGKHLDDIKKMQVSYDTGLSKDDTTELAELEQVIKDKGLSNRFTLENGKLIAKGVNDAMLKSENGRKEIFDDLQNGLIDRIAKANSDVGTGKIKVNSRGAKIVVPEFDDQNKDFVLDISKGSGIDPEQLQRFVNDRKFRNNFDVIKTPIKGRDGSFTNGVLRFVPKLDIDKTKAFNDLSRATSKYIDPEKFVSKATKSVDIGKNKEILDQIGYAGYHNGKIYSENEALLRKAQELVNRKKTSINKLSDFMNASSDYIVDGNGHGLSENDVKMDARNVTKRFVANDKKTTMQGLSALANLSKVPDLVSSAQSLQSEVDRSIMDSLGGPVQLVNEYQQLIKSNDIRTGMIAKRQMKEIIDLARSTGTDQFKDMPEDIQKEMSSKVRLLNKQLSDDRALNDIQSSIISSGSVPNAKNLIERRRNLMSNTGLSPSESSKVFKNMTSGQIGEFSAQIGSMKNIKIDDNGVLSTDIDKTQAGDQRKNDIINKRIMNMIKSISND